MINYKSRLAIVVMSALVLTFLLFAFTTYRKDTQGASPPASQEFSVKRGVNISHWLSQSKRRGKERELFFQEKDVTFIKAQGFDHIRIPIDEEQMWDEAGKKEKAAFALLHNGIKWASNHGMRVVVDLHILRSHHFNEAEKPLWTDENEQEKFFQCWRDLSEELIQYPNSLVAYELMNEPVADDPEDWNKLVEKCLKVVRENEPERTVVIGSNLWQSVHTFEDLKIPENDKNILLSFHFYIPFIITHYRTSWTDLKDYDGPVKYPGLTVEDKNLEGLTGQLYERIKNEQKFYTIDSLDALMQLPIKKAKAYDLPLYCGEWGCYMLTPEASRLQWYKDVKACLEKNNIGWANWDYKGRGFGIVDKDGKPRKKLIKAILE